MRDTASMHSNPLAAKVIERMLLALVIGLLSCIGACMVTWWYVTLTPELPVPLSAQEIVQASFLSGPDHESYTVEYVVQDTVDTVREYYVSRGAHCGIDTCTGSTFLNRGLYDVTIERTENGTTVHGIVTWTAP